MNAKDILGPETASEERQSHINEAPMDITDLEKLHEQKDTITFQELRMIHRDALRRAISVKSTYLYEMTQKALSHAVAALSARFLWLYGNEHRYLDIASRETARAIKLIQSMLQKLYEKKSKIFLYEDLLNGTLNANAIIRHLCCIIPQHERDALLEPIRERFSHLLKGADHKSAAFIYCELAETAEMQNEEKDKREFAQLAVLCAGKYYKKMERDGNTEEAFMWKAKTWSMAERFRVRILPPTT